jgi:hypothetical protein
MSRSFLKNFPVLKKERTYGAVATHVAMFSGCSIHNLCFTFASVNFLERFCNCSSLFTSSTTALDIEVAAGENRGRGGDRRRRCKEL